MEEKIQDIYSQPQFVNEELSLGDEIQVGDEYFNMCDNIWVYITVGLMKYLVDAQINIYDGVIKIRREVRNG